MSLAIAARIDEQVPGLPAMRPANNNSLSYLSRLLRPYRSSIAAITTP
jgi:hypothetical protein